MLRVRAQMRSSEPQVSQVPWKLARDPLELFLREHPRDGSDDSRDDRVRFGELDAEILRDVRGELVDTEGRRLFASLEHASLHEWPDRLRKSQEHIARFAPAEMLCEAAHYRGEGIAGRYMNWQICASLDLCGEPTEELHFVGDANRCLDERRPPESLKIPWQLGNQVQAFFVR